MTTAGFRVVRSYLRLPPEPGGMEQHIARLTRGQRALGVPVLSAYNVGEDEGEAVQVLRGRDLRPIQPAPLRNAVFYAALLAKAERLRGRGPTVLHVHGDWSAFRLAASLGRAIKADLMAASVHDFVPPGRDGQLAAALAPYDLVFCTGKSDQERLQRLLGRTAHHMPSAPDDLFFAAPEPAGPFDCDVICVTNFFAKKRPLLALDCAAKRPDLRFHIYGDGPLLPQAQDQIARQGLANVRLMGRRPRAEIAQALAKARVFLSPAEREGTPTAALEAMAVGLPVILTPSNDYGWLIEAGVNGHVTGGWTVDELTTAIDRVLGDETRRAQMGRANRVRARAHTWEANAERVTRLMAASLEHHPA